MEHRSHRKNSPFPSQESRETTNSTKVAPFSFSGTSLQNISRLDPNLFGSSSPSSPSIEIPSPPTCSLLNGGTVHLRRNASSDPFCATVVHQFEVSKGFQIQFTSAWAWPNNIIKSDSPFLSLSRPKVMDEEELFQLFTFLNDWVVFSEFSDEFTGISHGWLLSYLSSGNYLPMDSSDLKLLVKRRSTTSLLRSVFLPNVKWKCLFISITVLLFCVEVRSGPEDATDFVSTKL
ncbi:hypothetical protein Bca4012_022758 [Brassica carinata]